MAPKVIVAAVDASTNAFNALRWAVHNVLENDDTLHVITVAPRDGSFLPPAPTSPLAMDMGNPYFEQYVDTPSYDNNAFAADLLIQASNIVRNEKQSSVVAKVISKTLPPIGGAQGVGESIVDYAKAVCADCVILGSRGLGSFQRSVAPLVRLGSVSDYCVHHLHCGVGVIREPKDRVFEEVFVYNSERIICVALDDSNHANQCLQYTLQHVLRPEDSLHLVSVTMPLPFALHCSEAELKKQAYEQRQELLERAGQVATDAGVPQSKIRSTVLEAGGTGYDVAGPLCQYVQRHKADLLVLGCRGMGAIKRSFSAMIGVGSVSDHCVHNSYCPVLVIKSAHTASYPSTPSTAKCTNASATEKKMLPVVEPCEPSTSAVH